MPFCTSGDLFSYVQSAGRFQEDMARYWFRQLLDVRFDVSLLVSLSARIYIYVCLRLCVC
jgi:serine/threonine protein kinase